MDEPPPPSGGKHRILTDRDWVLKPDGCNPSGFACRRPLYGHQDADRDGLCLPGYAGAPTKDGREVWPGARSAYPLPSSPEARAITAIFLRWRQLSI